MANREVREVLEYLLAHDEDGTFKPLEDGIGPFLCRRIGQMQDEGQISNALEAEAAHWIMTKIHPHSTLSAYHWTHHRDKPAISVVQAEWPEIRRRYLHEWIRELKSRENDV